MGSGVIFSQPLIVKDGGEETAEPRCVRRVRHVQLSVAASQQWSNRWQRGRSSSTERAAESMAGGAACGGGARRAREPSGCVRGGGQGGATRGRKTAAAR